MKHIHRYLCHLEWKLLKEYNLLNKADAEVSIHIEVETNKYWLVSILVAADPNTTLLQQKGWILKSDLSLVLTQPEEPIKELILQFKDIKEQYLDFRASRFSEERIDEYTAREILTGQYENINKIPKEEICEMWCDYIADYSELNAEQITIKHRGKVIYSVSVLNESR